jgi:hypothetical protein
VLERVIVTGIVADDHLADARLKVQRDAIKSVQKCLFGVVGDDGDPDAKRATTAVGHLGVPP